MSTGGASEASNAEFKRFVERMFKEGGQSGTTLVAELVKARLEVERTKAQLEAADQARMDAQAALAEKKTAIADLKEQNADLRAKLEQFNKAAETTAAGDDAQATQEAQSSQDAPPTDIADAALDVGDNPFVKAFERAQTDATADLEDKKRNAQAAGLDEVDDPNKSSRATI